MFSIRDALNAIPKLLTARKELELAKLRGQLAVKEQRITDLEAELRLKHEMEFRNGFYFSRNDAFPFCQHCWEVDEVRVHLGSPFKHTGGGFGYACTRCKGVSRSATLHPGTTLAPALDDAPISVVGGRSSLREELDKYF